MKHYNKVTPEGTKDYIFDECNRKSRVTGNLKQIFKEGKCVYENPDIHVLREYCKLETEKLWDEVKRFENPHKYYVDLSPSLWKMKYDLLEKFQ